MRTKRCLASALGVGVAFAAGAFGQSMIEYGHGVARAGAAGAASGGGIAGIFTSLNETSDDAAKGKKKGKYAAPKAEADVEIVERETWQEPGAPPNAPLKMETSSGVVVSGVQPTWMTSAYREPMREPVRVKQVEWSNPEEEQAAIEQREIEDAALGQQESVTPGSTRPASSDAASSREQEAGAPGQVVGRSDKRFSADASAGPGTPDVPQLEPVTTAEMVGIRVGSSIEEVIATLGRPSFSFNGIVGKPYTEKYVFKKADGQVITVLTWAGKVTSVAIS